MKAEISVVKCADYDPGCVLEAVRRGIDLIGGISAFVPAKSRVLVKPNLLMAKEPASGVDTHPEVVRAVIKILKESGCAVYVGDGPSVWGKQAEDPGEVYERSGIKKVCEDEGAEPVYFENKVWRRGFPLAAWIDKCDCIVNVPKFKTHEMMTLTGAIKNLFGFVWKTHKTELHKKYYDKHDFARMLVDIYEEVRPSLTVVDGIVAMEGDGPATGGKLRNLGLLLAGKDCVAIDSIMALIMGIEPKDISSTRQAAARGLGTADIRSISIMGESLKDVIDRPFILPSSSLRTKLPSLVVRLLSRFVKYYPYADNDKCVRCGYCIQACPNKIISIKNNRLAFDYSGCIACFCCQEACPHAAIKIKRSLAARMIGL
ncbi:MAG: DUF362 domain-containing protein [Candidatus Omnitrophota bacterium]|jgi:uncharacterized protein (DUF362 family)/Pyruvate/2-oxoacid:ferredoxin oxidoreductase delta subunit